MNYQNKSLTLHGKTDNKNDMKKQLLTIAWVCLLSLPASAQGFETATEAVRNMKVGWNLGNTLDCHSDNINNMWIEAWTNRTPSDYETAWKQTVTKSQLFTMFKEAGFNAIRIPVTWYPHMEAKFQYSQLKWDPETNSIGTKIQAAWMKRVHEVVDYVISQGMYCILNVHHDTGAANTAWLIASGENYNKQKERFEAVWKQIAEEFKDYGDHLLFEGYNEMLDKYKSWCFASFGSPANYNASDAADAYKAINNYAQSFVNAVRVTGGNNAQRNLIVNTYGSCSGGGTWNTHLKDPLKEMKYPTDAAGPGHIIFQVHTYPALVENNKNRPISSIQNEVNDMISAWKTHLVSKGAPVIVGEWGTSNVDAEVTDYDARRPLMLQFVEYFVKRCKDNDITTFYWMGLSDGSHRSVPEFNQPDLKDAIIKGYYGEGGYTSVKGIKSVPFDPTQRMEAQERTTAIHDLQGRAVKNPRKGIYLRKGMKYVVR